MEGDGKGGGGADSSVVPLALPQNIVRGLGDRSYEKRKGAALEVEALVKALAENHEKARLESVLHMLGQDFCTSSNSNHRKGGLHGLAATAIGLMGHIKDYLHLLLPPVLHCFDDHESRVRYYACESLYNVAKVARQEILPHFNPIFEGLCKLFADGDPDVKNGAQLLDRLIKDVVTESDLFDVEKFIPLLQKYIRRTNPYIRILLVGWITVLDQVPDINMLDWLPDFLDGLFNMLSDDNKEIRQAAEKCLAEFLREMQASVPSVDFGAMVPILVGQCSAKDRFIRFTAVSWVREFIRLAPWERLLGFSSDLLGAVMHHGISDPEEHIRLEAERTNEELLVLVRETKQPLDYAPLLHTLLTKGGLLHATHHVPTRVACLRWISMLLEKSPHDMAAFIDDVLPALIKTLSDPADEVVLLNLQVLARLALNDSSEFLRVLNHMVDLFQHDRRLLEHRGSLVIRQLCVLLDAQSIYMSLASVLQTNQDLEFVSMMVQTLNLILLTASELAGLRAILKAAFATPTPTTPQSSPPSSSQGAGALLVNKKSQQQSQPLALAGGGGTVEKEVFRALYSCWCHNPVAALSLCLLAQAYCVSARLVEEFAAVQDITVGFLMQVDKLVQLLESPIFVVLRLQLLDRDAPLHAHLLKSLYGLLMILPQSSAYRTLADRLLTVSTHHNIIAAAAAASSAAPPRPTGSKSSSNNSRGAGYGSSSSSSSVGGGGSSSAEAEQEEVAIVLVSEFRSVQETHAQARAAERAKRSLLLAPPPPGQQGQGGGADAAAPLMMISAATTSTASSSSGGAPPLTLPSPSPRFVGPGGRVAPPPPAP